MSRRPDVETVTKLRQHIGEYQRICARLTSCREQAALIPGLEKAMRDEQRAITHLIEEMDCKASGNMGWEHRITWMLVEILRQEGQRL